MRKKLRVIREIRGKNFGKTPPISPPPRSKTQKNDQRTGIHPSGKLTTI
jgi:hypothetical protein